MKNPCKECIVNTTCCKFHVSCQDHWDYTFWKFTQNEIILRVFEENKKFKRESEVKI